MRINSLDLIRYGKFEGKPIDLPHAEQDIHVIVGPNEAGKSTISAAIVELMYSIAKSSPHAFRHRGDSRLGAVIEHKGQVLAFHRSKGLKATLRTPDDAVLADGALADFVGSSDRQSFTEMFGLDHDRLVQGGTSILGGSDDLGKILFEAAAGVNNLGAIQTALDDEAGKLWDVRKSQNRAYYVAAAEFEKATALLRDSTVNAKEWAVAHAAMTDQDNAYAEARKRHAEVKSRQTMLERVRRLGSHLDTLDQVTARLLAMGNVVELPADAEAIAQAAQVASVAAQSTFEDQSALAQRHSQAIEVVEVDENLMSAEADIKALNDRRIQYQPYAVDMANLQVEIDAHWKLANSLAQQIGWHPKDSTDLQNRLPDNLQRKVLLRLVRANFQLDQTLETHRQAVKDKTAEIRDTDDALKALATEETHPALDAAMLRTQKLGDHESMTQDYQLQVVRKQALRDAALVALGPWPVLLDALRAMTPPSLDLIHSLTKEQQSDDTESKAARRKLQTIQQDIEDSELAIRQFNEAHHPVTRDQVLAMRGLRETAWHGIRADVATLESQASDFESLVAQADSLADQHHEKIQLASSLQSLQQQLDRLVLDARHAQAEVQVFENAAHARMTDWSALTQRCGLPPLPFATATHWLSSRQQALNAADELEVAESSLAVHLDKVADAQNSLARQLAALGKADGSESLAVLQAIGMSLFNSATAAAGKRASLEAQHARAASNLRVLNDEAGRSLEALKTWQVQWNDAVAPWHFARPDDLDAVESVLEKVEHIDQSLAAMKNLRVARIDAMQANLKDFTATANTLAGRISPDLIGLEINDLVVTLHERLSQNLNKKKELDRLRLALDVAQENANLATVSLKRSSATLAPIFERSNTSTNAELAQAIHASDLARQLRNDISTATKMIRDAGDGFTLDAVKAEAVLIDKTRLMDELVTLKAQEDELLQTLSGIAARRQEARTNLEAISGSADGARAEGQRQEALSKMAEAVDSYLKVRTASRLLKWSIDQYRDVKQAPMLAVAGRIFSMLTLASFERLVVDYEGKLPRLQGRRANGELVDIEGLSDGTRDQLYLALRLAALDMHLDKAHALPFIADDLFINYSDGRSRAGLMALADLSRKTQVIFLTHHEHLIPVIEEALGKNINIVRL